MIDGWSFCIVTAQGNDDVLIRCVYKILDEFSDTDNFEIIIIGNCEASFNSSKVSQIPFNEYIFKPNLALQSLKSALEQKTLKPLLYRTGAICHKKNLAAKHAVYDKLCFMHDYVGIEPGWRSGFSKYGTDWQVCMNIILNNDNSRHRDWMAWDHPYVTSSSNGEGACLIPYDKYTEFMYISGTYFCVKNEFYQANPLDENRFWGEAEDVEWSLRVRNSTIFKMNVFSTVKYLKLKDVNDAPYCESWKRNEKLMLRFFNEIS